MECINVTILAVILYYIVLQDVTIGGDWVKGTQDHLHVNLQLSQNK